MLKILCLTTAVLLPLSCSTTHHAPYGVQTDQVAYIPARIAVWPCQQWPEKVRYLGRPLSNVPDKEFTAICQDFDRYIIDGFKDQPYMRGLSPKVVNALLARASHPKMLQELAKQWLPDSESCQDCADPVNYYLESLANRESWQQWLNLFSERVYNSDAILLPLINYARQGRTDDRGIAEAYYRVGVTVLLIDTESGRLIWAGGRDALASNRKIANREQLRQLAFPSWPKVKERLLVKDIWREFPGRQNY